ncbi:hypothetical protein [Serratia plymuthica]|nr:hypothetical protein [Serratia plymuthica]QPS23232.1 hypothetical protein I6G64_00840 [Serratia plymuthica]QPS58436.1 hypothetical protein I6G53_14445 [Serratia plymuthica]QPS65679.1 hypothetical protein I6G52_21585 [Serratia plymuthica]RKS65070.1 hypothetical protein C8E17_4425 [Serratia plymuthica]CAI1569551.1 Uncharacterised protein [Serratia plymuthica]
MKKLLLVLIMCTSGAHAAVVVTHAYGYGVRRPVVVVPGPTIVTPAPVIVVPAPAPVAVTALPRVTFPVAAVGAGIYRHNERQDAYDEINHLQDERINAYNQHHH